MSRVLVSGAGIAGLTLGYWLSQAGFDPTIIERSPYLRDEGYAIDFFGSGYDVAERMAIVNALEQRQVPVERIVYVDERGKKLASLEIERMKRFLGGRYVALMHQTLERVLFEALPNEISVRFGVSVTHVEQNGDGVIVAFSDGTMDRFDLLIGADGIHSLARALVAGPEEHFLRPIGYAVASYSVPDTFGLGPTWTMTALPGRTVGVYSSDRPGTAFALFMWKREGDLPQSRAKRLAELVLAFSDCAWIVPELLASAPDPHLAFIDVVAQIEMQRWDIGRVAFVGDACACPTFASGQGASLAMGGAYVLAECLSQESDYTAAFSRYQRRVRPYVLEQQRKARSFIRQFVPSTRFGISMQRVFLRAFFREPLIGLFGSQFKARSMVATERK